MSSTDVYSAEPALPRLATSFLSRPETEDSSLKSRDDPSQRWNLRRDMEAGIQRGANGVFKCGTVIGFSKLRGKIRDDDFECVGEVPRLLLSSLLWQETESSVFIIHPSNYAAFAPETLLASLLTSPHHQPAPTREHAIQRLNNVQLLSIFDLPSAVRAISSVSERLNELQKSRRTSPVLFIIAGLDTFTEATIRASNPVKGAALLQSTLRTLTRLSRVYAAFLSVMLVNTSGVGKSPGTGTPSDPSSDHIHSVFHTVGSLFPTLLMRTLDQGIDTHLLLSTVKGAQVVEVVKDRVGDGVGKWCIWKA
ncbi:hypothetical protein ASPZODRAFT_448052 [Penicilliopsis zonata CBS 506.65]|uniref:DNA recombination and repair protein Rad51-like C-terminal domain-containing protein n=1 Tax=Penicilliopsis zonata CBS 506.65 TaxID=1073090 RepID=A0A1L9SWX2_9EURO|nr:hypothetical protein ASPZODRAFT_448052 [Penicilliopsis zonata CBS 506.65]OJJ51680.1 hypothetical protein ASPZODRAFT_448052 [Penicilliopsis zonata CBS 506.65]